MLTVAIILHIISIGLRFQAPLIILAAVAPLFCLLDNMTVKHVFATLYYIATGGMLGSYGVILLIALSLVIKETEQVANKTDATVKALKNMKLMKSQLSSQAFQNSVLCILFAFWPFLQVRGSWNISISCPLVVHCLVIPLATYVFWPKDKKRKVVPDSNNLNSTAGIVTTIECSAGDEEARPASLVPVQHFAHG